MKEFSWCLAEEIVRERELRSCTAPEKVRRRGSFSDERPVLHRKKGVKLI
jgi:hypothetical protein